MLKRLPLREQPYHKRQRDLCAQRSDGLRVISGAVVLILLIAIEAEWHRLFSSTPIAIPANGSLSVSSGYATIVTLLWLYQRPA